MSSFRFRPWKTPLNPKTEVYDAEFIGSWHATMFMRIVKIYDRRPNIIADIVPEYEGNSRIKFLVTPKERKMIEYIYRRYIKVEKLYLMDLDTYQGNSHKMMRDRYAIY